MLLKKIELHDPCFCLEDVVTREPGPELEPENMVDSDYKRRVDAYWGNRYLLLSGGAFPTASEMVWQG